MTTKKQLKKTRDEVLFDFQQACACPTADDIIQWTTRYPEFAEDLRSHAAIARDWAAEKDRPAEKVDETMLARGYSLMLNAIYDAGVRTTNASAATSKSFCELMAMCGTDVPSLARKIGIARSVLADLVNGGILAPVGKRLMDAVTGALGVTVEEFEAALQRALSGPRLINAKSNSTPVVIPRAYEDVIRDTNMSQEQITYWLSE